ncbi:MAG TPA: hypothetical protein VI316_05125 [Candidatus Dormibacteraeota bacterium]
MRPAEWLRTNSERYLLEAAQRSMAAQHYGKAALPPPAPGGVFWRRAFVPVYRRLPWSLKHRIITAMPGSHRRRWRAFDDDPRQPGI